ncbi:MAG: hypothetical protein IJ703_04400 [Eubacterium sp.]|nr:hypothetical protein [Eubacterium sp.]
MRLAAIFSDHMVLQRDKTFFIFGETEKAVYVSVKIDDIEADVFVSAGAFTIGMPKHAAGGPYVMTVRACVEKDAEPVFEKKIRDVYFGEVWIENGQSNIEFEIQNAEGGLKELEEANLPKVRYFKSIKTPVVDEAVIEAEAQQTWHQLKNGDFRDMSGVGYFFAKKLHAELDVPIGIVDCYQGGTSISCWLAEERLAKYEEGRKYQEEFEESIKGQTEEEYNRLLLTYNEMVENHLTLAAEAKAKNPDITPEELSAAAGDYPWPPPMGLKSAFRPSGLYHTMIERIAPFQSRGLIYYQGEEDAVKYDRYEPLLKELMTEYRETFMDSGLPIAILQLPMFIGRGAEDKREWAYIRKAQDNAVKATEGALLVSLIDCGEYDNVHPVDKKTPGERTAARILKDVYGLEAGGSEPELIEAAEISDTSEVSIVSDGSVAAEGEQSGGYRYVLQFSNAGDGLITADNKLIDLRKELSSESSASAGDASGADNAADHIFGFEICLKDSGEWTVPADVSIDNDKVIIGSSEELDGIRYGFFDYGKVNLYNKAMMPVRPFEYLVEL